MTLNGNQQTTGSQASSQPVAFQKHINQLYYGMQIQVHQTPQTIHSMFCAHVKTIELFFCELIKWNVQYVLSHQTEVLH